MRALGLPHATLSAHGDPFADLVTQLQKGLIDMENMFELLERRSAVKDLPSAKPLTVSEGASRCAPSLHAEGSGAMSTHAAIDAISLHNHLSPQPSSGLHCNSSAANSCSRRTHCEP